ncbi:trafficking protein particle complex subunit 3 [Trichonephila clavipes]|uniref:Trafficking protein particle complex subunit n=1 Tax=Trichonephila inaurata madagascariensis TaxID=2747483 RepID=A0A8X7CNC7_9ARAC|nr:trafficking protein particle complex subunit 3 [Trichonephila clavipes]GFY70162.1 trafficking protein particle complex subunit 3 [Trichonephila inaurata madagascariensis]
MSRQILKVADSKKVSSELFALTYGSLVSQILKDYENDEDVNKQLERMGHNIGVRIVEDFLARTNAPRCHDLRDTADKLQTAFKLYLGLSPVVSNWNPAADEFSLLLDSNPLTEFVELPEGHHTLKYCNILAGVIRGALEMVQMEVQTWFVQDQLKGDNTTELRVKFVRRLEEAVPVGED